MKSNLLFTLVLIVIIGFVSVDAAGTPIKVIEIVRGVDRLYRSLASESEVEMTIITPNWERKLRLKMWSKGFEKTFIYIISPKKDRGIATLRVGTSMWNYFPKINKVIKVPPSMMMASWMGSDFTNDDLVKESSLLNDYTARFADKKNNYPDCYSIELIPKEKTATVWGKITLVVIKKNLLPLRQVFYDEKGEKIRVMVFKDVKKFGNRKIPAVLELKSLKHKGKKTTMRYITAAFDIEIDDNAIFTRRNLQKKR